VAREIGGRGSDFVGTGKSAIFWGKLGGTAKMCLKN
jgi:hypothetical protein